MLNQVADLLVLATCLLWTVAVLFGLRREQRFLISFLVTACLAGALQTAASDFRWQMVPAYVFLVLATLRATLDLSATVGLRVARWKKVTARTLLVLVTVIVIALPAMIFPRITYLKPGGPYPVGVRSEYWVDSTRSETLTSVPDDYRRLLVEIWYPADPGQNAARVRAHPAPDALANGLAASMPGGIPAFVFKSMATGLTWAKADQPVSGAEREFPLLIFSHGFGGTRTQNGFEMAELASHGYIIASIEHSFTATGTLFPDGTSAAMDSSALTVLSTDSNSVRIVNIWAADGRFIIDRMSALDRDDPRQLFTGRIDTTRVGYFGHSFGGATAAQIMSLDARVLTGINMDGYLAGTAWVNGLDRPFLQFRSDSIDIEGLPESQLQAAGTSRDQLRQLLRDWELRTAAVTRGGGMEIHLRGTSHLNYSDMTLWSPVMMRLGKQAGPIAPGRAHQLINEITLAWFDRHLKGKPVPVLDDLPGAYPEVEVLRK
jgi:predicted dienelactone hydrolase